WQFTNNFTLFKGDHAITVGANYERFGFFNSFNIFRHGVFFLPAPIGGGFGGTTFSSVLEFLESHNNDGIGDVDLSTFITPDDVPYKGELIDAGQISVYVQDEFAVSPRFNLTAGLRVDLPQYYTDPVD